jgi:hypothetical protein
MTPGRTADHDTTHDGTSPGAVGGRHGRAGVCFHMTVNVAKRTRRRAPATSAAPSHELNDEPAIEPSPVPPFRPALVPSPPPSPPPFIPRMVPGDSLTIGEINQTVFDCPRCSRPLALGARRCPGCSARLVNGVILSKASTFVAAGLAIGLLAGGGAGFLLGLGQSAAGAPALLPLATPAGSPSDHPIVASAAPSPSATAVPPTSTPSLDPGPGGSALPPDARAALIQVVGANDKLAAARTNLQSALADRIFDASAVARTLRGISADSVQGEQLATRIAGWTGSGAVPSRLDDFYGTVHDAAVQSLIASVRNADAYRAAARSMVALLADLPVIDSAVRAAATSGGLTLPASATPSPSTAP